MLVKSVIRLVSSLITLVCLSSQLNGVFNNSVLVEANNLQESKEFMNGKVLRVAVIHVRLFNCIFGFIKFVLSMV